uniref:Uncharacterized protein n=1 Tax=Trichogramma kaykai TaxID=54128 RepID=A0ABD2X295_9HYME
METQIKREKSVFHNYFAGARKKCCKYTNHIVASYKPARSNHTNLRAHRRTTIRNLAKTYSPRKTTRKIGSRAAICEATKKVFVHVTSIVMELHSY